MSTYKTFVIGLGYKHKATKDDPNGIVKEYAKFEHVNNTENVLAGIDSFNGIRTAYKSLYGATVAHICHINNFTDYDLCRLFANEVEPNNKDHIVEDTVLKNRNTGAIVAVGMMDPVNKIHFFKCNNTHIDRDRRITFKKITFRKFFYAIADDRKGFNTYGRMNGNIAYSDRKGIDATVTLVMIPKRGGTGVKATS